MKKDEGEIIIQIILIDNFVLREFKLRVIGKNNDLSSFNS